MEAKDCTAEGKGKIKEIEKDVFSALGITSWDEFDPKKICSKCDFLRFCGQPISRCRAWHLVFELVCALDSDVIYLGPDKLIERGKKTKII